jgi:cyclohexadieny/prephenate dehydrogenase
MEPVVKQLTIIGQGLIGSSITRAAIESKSAWRVVVTDSSPKVRKRVAELGLGVAKVVDNNIEAVQDSDLVIACVPVGQYGALAKQIGPHLKHNSIFSDVGSVKGSVVRDVKPFIPRHTHFVPAHPLAGTERSGPDSGQKDLFLNRWCILTPLRNPQSSAVEKASAFWQTLGSQVQIMSVKHHDQVLALTSHVPHLIAFTIFHTAIRQEKITDSEVMKYSAGGFRDFTRIASSNPTMWRDIFLNNKQAVLSVLKHFESDLNKLSTAIENGDAHKVFKQLSESRRTRRKVIEKEHISVVTEKARRIQKSKEESILFRPYSSND